MGKMVKTLLRIKGNIFSGLIALMIISLVVLGCTCNQEEGFKWDSEKSESTESSDNEIESEKDDETFKANVDEIPTDEQAEVLVKTSLMAFNEAVAEGDFANFLKTVSKARRESSKASDLNKTFKVFIDKKVDFSEIRDKTPKFDPGPYIQKKYGRRLLFLEGTYQTSKYPVRFDFAYTVEDDEWKLLDIGVYTGNK